MRTCASNMYWKQPLNYPPICSGVQVRHDAPRVKFNSNAIIKPAKRVDNTLRAVWMQVLSGNKAIVLVCPSVHGQWDRVGWTSIAHTIHKISPNWDPCLPRSKLQSEFRDEKGNIRLKRRGENGQHRESWKIFSDKNRYWFDWDSNLPFPKILAFVRNSLW